MSRLFALLLAGLVLAGTPAMAAPITFNTALPVTWGEWILRLQAKGFGFASDPTALNRDLSVDALPVVGVYGLTPRFTLFAIAPLLDKKLEVDTPLGRRGRGDSGLGDVTLLARYTAWRRDAPGRTLRLAPFGGIEAPTGRDDAGDDLGRLPPSLQLGSGTLFSRATCSGEIGIGWTVPTWWTRAAPPGSWLRGSSMCTGAGFWKRRCRS